MLVGRRMTRNPITIGLGTAVTEAQALMRREKISHLPVIDKNGKLVGMITEKDILYASPSPATSLNIWEISYLLSKLPVDKVMTRPVITVDEDAPLEDAARIMADRKIGGLPVMRKDLMVGIVTETDLFRVFAELFGVRKKGVRLTLLIPEKRGELAQISSAIYKKGGNILAFGTFLGEDSTNTLATIKVEGIPQDELVKLLRPYVQEVMDVRAV